MKAFTIRNCSMRQHANALTMEIRAERLQVLVSVSSRLRRSTGSISTMQVFARCNWLLPHCRQRPSMCWSTAGRFPIFQTPQNSFDKGDGINFSIAAASIVAKVYRDRLMTEMDSVYPGYGFAEHKGYATPVHQAAIRKLGPCAIHRKSFDYIRELCGLYSRTVLRLERPGFGSFKQDGTAGVGKESSEWRKRRCPNGEQEDSDDGAPSLETDL